MKFEASGTVHKGDAWRCDPEEANGAVHIDNVDVVDEIWERKWQENVTAFINGRLVGRGKLFTEYGGGFSEYTPIDEDRCAIGTTNLIESLLDYEGQQVTLLVTDEQ